MAISIGALVIALCALVVLFIFMRRGGVQAVGGVVAEVRRRTRQWRRRTRIGGGAPVPTLTVISDMSRGERFNLAESVIFLGREEERADVVLYWDEYVSRRHAKIAQEGTQFYIWDMNSANGTWVNEQRVPRSLSEGVDLTEAVPLRDGDVIRLGPDLRLRFSLAGEAEQEPSPAAGESPEAESPTQVIRSPAAAGREPALDGEGLVDTQASPRGREK